MRLIQQSDWLVSIMSGLVIRLGGVEQPETRIFSQDAITIGTSPVCDLSFRPEEHHETEVPLSDQLLELELSSGVYRVSEIHQSTEVMRDGEPVAIGDAVRDGDTFYFGKSGIRLRFFFLTPSVELAESLKLGTAVLTRARSEARTGSESVMAQAEDATVTQSGQPGQRRLRLPFERRRQPEVPRTDVAIVFVKQLLRELIAEIPRTRLYLALAAIGLIVGTIIYTNALSFFESRRNNKAIEDLKLQITDLNKGLNSTREEIKTTSDAANRIKEAMAFAPNVVDNYQKGVCLIYGVYVWVDPRSGREARFKEPTDNYSPISPGGSVNLSVDGNGPVCEMDFIGTGFLAAKGMVLTNRHVAQPWYGDAVATVIRGQGLRPRIKELYGYFPKTPQPFKLLVLETSQISDVAVCSFEPGNASLPVLPMDEKGEASVSGQSVVLLGYPAGIDGLLAKIDDNDPVLNRRVPLQTLLNELATRSQITPYSTQGHISDLTQKRIVYDAQTSEGGSGGPVFGANRKVIAINQAILPGSPANFGVPIRYGVELMKKYLPGMNPPPEDQKAEANKE
jgi:S1-C subfamily serine protease